MVERRAIRSLIIVGVRDAETDELPAMSSCRVVMVIGGMR